jgi:Arc/MetJ-type ribon-helix-helix transcriptional regulator
VKKMMIPITVHLPEPYLAALEQLVSLDQYPTRAEAIRSAIRDMLKRELQTGMIGAIK